MNRELWEAHVTPKFIVVHNPADFGALDRLTECGDNARLNEHYLFRERPDPSLFSRDHRTFVQTLMEAGAKVRSVSEILGPDIERYREILKNDPNQVYARDAAVTLPWDPHVFLPCRMGRPIRVPEETVMRAVLEKLWLEAAVEIPEWCVLEGGDVMPFSAGGERILLIGYGRRTNRMTIDFLRTAILPKFADRIIGVELAEWRINLDGGMVVLSDDTVVIHRPSLLSAVSVTKDEVVEWFDFTGFLASEGYSFIEVEKDESKLLQACNCVCLGNRTVVAYDLTPDVYRRMVERGIRVFRVPGKELVKWTGWPRCMTRPVY